MKSHTRPLIAIVGIIGLGLMMPLTMAVADAQPFEQLSAEWQQWSLSIPASVNPVPDSTGIYCMVGQRGALWFLVGSSGSGPIMRTCMVPEGTTLFFPVINFVNIDTPKVCGQGPKRIPVEDLRAGAAAFIDGAINLLVEVDGKPIGNLQRVQSNVFEIALPEDNVFDAPCSSLGGVPAGIYSPAVDDGYYVLLSPLKGGKHTLHIHAENLGDPSNPDDDFVLDVTYHLTVVPVSLE
jgi:hypothetical protein